MNVQARFKHLIDVGRYLRSDDSMLLTYSEVNIFGSITEAKMAFPDHPIVVIPTWPDWWWEAVPHE